MSRDALDQTIAKVKAFYSNVTDPSVFADLLAIEKKGKKRKMLKRWLRERIKLLEGKQNIMAQPDFISSPLLSSYMERIKTPKDKITGIPIIG